MLSGHFTKRLHRNYGINISVLLFESAGNGNVLTKTPTRLYLFEIIMQKLA